MRAMVALQGYMVLYRPNEGVPPSPFVLPREQNRQGSYMGTGPTRRSSIAPESLQRPDFVYDGTVPRSTVAIKLSGGVRF